jgi:hypothetical protein
MPYLSSTAMPLLSLVLRSRGRPGSPSRRAGRTDFVAECSAEMVATENELHSCAVIAIAVYDDPWYHLTRDAVQEAVEHPSVSIGGTLRSTSTEAKVSWCYSLPQLSTTMSLQPTLASLWDTPRFNSSDGPG